MKQCVSIQFQHGITVELWQRADKSFRVKYGLCVKDKMTYAEAAVELGTCVMHAAACQNQLDNS